MKWSREHVEEKNQALDFGTCAHAYILENQTDNFIVYDGEGDKRSKAYKDFVQANEGKIILSVNEWVQLQKMRDAFRNCKYIKNNYVQPVVECSFFADVNDLSFRARPDAYIETAHGVVIFDYKTTISINQKSFVNSILNYGYDISAAHYARIIEKSLEKPVVNFVWVAQEKTAPYEVAVFKMSDDWLAHSIREWEMLTNKIKVAFLDNNFPDQYQGEATTLDLPYWLNKQETDFL